MSKAIKSTNPLKPIIVALLKAKSGATRVTSVVETEDEEGNKIYRGNCLSRIDGLNMYVGETFSVYEDAVINASYKNRRG